MKIGDCVAHDWSDGKNALQEVCSVKWLGKRYADVLVHSMIGFDGETKRVILRRRLKKI